MNKTRFGPGLFLFLSIVLISGCSHVISKELRDSAKKELLFPTVQKNPEIYGGETVIWGGVIIQTLNRKEGTEIQILETPLDISEKPEDSESSQGRFIAKTPQYLDPEVYQKGKKITVAGPITGEEVLPLGEIQYTYPVVSITEMHLWKKEVRVYPDPYYYGPYPWHPWSPWWYYPW
jgi:outer membrane lipoprotein